MYRRRLISPPPRDSESLVNFLKSLEMVLKVRNRTGGEIARAHQLINKTNQFNLNGIRLEESDLRAVLDGGGRIITATLEDRTGNHGEILACLIDASGLVRSFVMSCRVFERRVEFAFLVWLLNHWDGPPLHFTFEATERNEPIRRFLKDRAFAPGSMGWSVNSSLFVADHSEDVDLFSVQEVPL
jgi:FkbH-like protein